MYFNKNNLYNVQIMRRMKVYSLFGKQKKKVRKFNFTRLYEGF